jgi:hypothetical protein
MCLIVKDRLKKVQMSGILEVSILEVRRKMMMLLSVASGDFLQLDPSFYELVYARVFRFMRANTVLVAVLLVEGPINSLCTLLILSLNPALTQCWPLKLAKVEWAPWHEAGESFIICRSQGVKKEVFLAYLSKGVASTIELKLGLDGVKELISGSERSGILVFLFLLDI